jgi:membrane carboxypeptidase/penicillin-binding protein
VSPDVARGTIDAGRCPVGDRSPTTRCTGGTATAIRRIVGRPVSGKTGTTDNSRTATMTVASRQLVVSGFIADTDWPMHSGVGSHPIINNAVAYTLKDATAGMPALDFTPPSPAIVGAAKTRSRSGTRRR